MSKVDNNKSDYFNKTSDRTNSSSSYFNESKKITYNQKANLKQSNYFEKTTDSNQDKYFDSLKYKSPDKYDKKNIDNKSFASKYNNFHNSGKKYFESQSNSNNNLENSDNLSDNKGERYFDKSNNYNSNRNYFNNTSGDNNLDKGYFFNHKNTSNKYQNNYHKKSNPEINAVYEDAKIYRKEKYGIFVNFDNNNYEGMIHISKLLNNNLESFKIDQILKVKISDIKERNKISLTLVDDSKSINYCIEKDNTTNISKQIEKDDFPDLSKKLNNEDRQKSSVWSKKLDDIKKPPDEKISTNSSFVFCKLTKERLSLDKAIKCKENEDSIVFYFKSAYHAHKYNNINNTKFKIVGKDNKLEYLPNIIFNNNNKVDSKKQQLFSNSYYDNNLNDSDNFDKDYDNNHRNDNEDYDNDDNENEDNDYE